ncbi:MAG TPA: type II secretion system F family protein [Candidatus Limnocylindria bacterium]|nr:type II secretion system F family protein [Candidatus Limnocylindria bacterium]
MGALAGLLLGLGVVLVLSALSRSEPIEVKAGPGRFDDLVGRSGVDGATVPRTLAVCAACGGITAFLTLGVSRSPAIAGTFAVLAAYAPIAYLRWRGRLRADELRAVWPDVVDNLASAVRAGLSLPEALTQLATRGPELLRADFSRFGEDYRATGRFGECLDRLKDGLADPVGDRIVESLRLARDVGGTDLGGLLRTLSTFLREDARTRAELETRQSWTVNSARLAVAAPWVLLGLLALRPEAVAAYNSVAGLVLLLVGAAVCVVAYRLMLRIGRLPAEERVLR